MNDMLHNTVNYYNLSSTLNREMTIKFICYSYVIVLYIPVYYFITSSHDLLHVVVVLYAMQSRNCTYVSVQKSCTVSNM